MLRESGQRFPFSLLKSSSVGLSLNKWWSFEEELINLYKILFIVKHSILW